MRKFDVQFTPLTKVIFGWSYIDKDFFGISLGWSFYIHLGLIHIGVNNYYKQEDDKKESKLEVIKGGK